MAQGRATTIDGIMARSACATGAPRQGARAPRRSVQPSRRRRSGVTRKNGALTSFASKKNTRSQTGTRSRSAGSYTSPLGQAADELRARMASHPPPELVREQDAGVAEHAAALGEARRAASESSRA